MGTVVCKGGKWWGITCLTLIIVYRFLFYLQSIGLLAGTEYLPHRTDPVVLELNQPNKKTEH